MDWPWLILLGLGTGSYGVLVGAGGGFLIVSVLLMASHMQAPAAVGTSLALVAVNSVSGWVAYRRLGLVDLRSGLIFAATAIPGAVLAPFIVREVSGGTFRILFGLLMVLLGSLVLVRTFRLQSSWANPRVRHQNRLGSRHIEAKGGQVFDYEFNEILAAGFNFLLGFVSSFFGTGGGFLRTPILVTAFGFPVRVAVATSIFALMFYSTAGAAAHAALGHVEWYPTFFWTGIGLAVGGQVGAFMASKIRGSVILRLLVVLLLALGVQMIVQGIRG